MKHFKIRKGTHRSVNSWFPRFHINRKNIGYMATFKSGARYDLVDVDQLDINKLFGISYGMHHNNSARFGWRWNLEREMIEILAYVYVDGVRVTQDQADLHVCFVFPGIPYNYEIALAGDYYMFTINSKTFSDTKVVKIKHNGNLTWWGYKLFPYFGGNEGAPETVCITLE